MILYDGPSLINNDPIIAIMTGIDKNSKNPKTNDMLQLWILNKNIHPMDALKNGDDIGICGDCKHRPQINKIYGYKRCYVKVHQAPSQVWRSFHRNKYPKYQSINVDKPVRLGAYGDPGSLPYYVILDAINIGNGSFTGYTHQWKVRPDLINYCMASVDSLEEQTHAQTLGWRTFRVTKESVKRLNEISCPASKEMNHRSSCASCLLCDGNKYINNSRKNIVILNH